MNVQEIADQFLAEATRLADLDAPFATLHLYTGQRSDTIETPSLWITAEAERVFRERSGIVRVKLEIEGLPADDGEDPANHRSRVAMVRNRFVELKAERIAAINQAGVINVGDYQLVMPLPVETGTDEQGRKYRTTFTLRCVIKPPAI